MKRLLLIVSLGVVILILTYATVQYWRYREYSRMVTVMSKLVDDHGDKTDALKLVGKPAEISKSRECYEEWNYHVYDDRYLSLCVSKDGRIVSLRHYRSIRMTNY